MNKKKELGTHVISQGPRFRECVKIYKNDKDIRMSKTFHQEKIYGEWKDKNKNGKNPFRPFKK